MVNVQVLALLGEYGFAALAGMGIAFPAVAVPFTTAVLLPFATFIIRATFPTGMILTNPMPTCPNPIALHVAELAFGARQSVRASP